MKRTYWIIAGIALVAIVALVGLWPKDQATNTVNQTASATSSETLYVHPDELTVESVMVVGNTDADDGQKVNVAVHKGSIHQIPLDNTHILRRTDFVSKNVKIPLTKTVFRKDENGEGILIFISYAQSGSFTSTRSMDFDPRDREIAVAGKALLALKNSSVTASDLLTTDDITRLVTHVADDPSKSK